MFYILAKLGVKRLRPYFCKIGWHSSTKDYIRAKTPTHYICPWCGLEGLVDSQGNLFPGYHKGDDDV